MNNKLKLKSIVYFACYLVFTVAAVNQSWRPYRDLMMLFFFCFTGIFGALYMVNATHSEWKWMIITTVMAITATWLGDMYLLQTYPTHPTGVIYVILDIVAVSIPFTIIWFIAKAITRKHTKV